MHTDRVTVAVVSMLSLLLFVLSGPFRGLHMNEVYHAWFTLLASCLFRTWLVILLWRQYITLKC